MSYLFLIIGFALLSFCSDWLVDGSSAIAKRFRVSDLVIGMTIVAIGTSLPELVVNLFSSIQGNNELAITNILGSNTLNTLVVLGITAIICPVRSSGRTLQKDIPLSILAAFLVMMFATDYFGKGTDIEKIIFKLSGQTIEHCEGIGCFEGGILLLGFGLFMYQIFKYAREDRKALNQESTIKSMPIWKATLLIAGGLAGLIAGGKLVVDSAVDIATSWGVSEGIVGITIVALGTSLPELFVSVIAARKGHTDLAIGNVIGSNVMNIFLILGLSAVIHPIPHYENALIDAGMATLSGIILLYTVINDDRHDICRWEGIMMLVLYAVYMMALFV